jgi:hypothetical protein
MASIWRWLSSRASRSRARRSFSQLTRANSTFPPKSFEYYAIAKLKNMGWGDFILIWQSL